VEPEEFEEIPWASLVAEQSDGVDRRIYLAVGVVGLLVVAVFGMRLFSNGSQPTPPQAIAVEPPPTTVTAKDLPSPPSTLMVVAESDLMAETPVTPDGPDQLALVTAEWFVTDWFTRDGSEETVRSIRSALSPRLEVKATPHETDGEPMTFVEWAKATRSEITAGGVDITVAYRAIRQTDEGFVRDPVRIVTMSLERDGSEFAVSSLPTGS
jgi:hypothetical protein